MMIPTNSAITSEVKISCAVWPITRLMSGQIGWPVASETPSLLVVTSLTQYPYRTGMGLSSPYLWRRSWYVCSENRGLCLIRAAGLPLNDTAVKIRKLVTRRTGIAYSTRRITKASIGYSILLAALKNPLVTLDAFNPEESAGDR